MRNRRSTGSLLPTIRALRVTTWVVLIAFGLYLGFAGYSAVTLAPSGTGSGQFALLPDGTITIVTMVNLSNPGFFAFTGLSIASTIAQPNSSLPWLHSSSAEVNLPAGGVAHPTLRFSLDISHLGAETGLLVHDTSLNETDYLNGTYANFVGFNVVANESLAWGAPFDGLSGSVGAPVPESNGTVGVQVKISFTNDAPFAVDGVLQAVLLSAGGASCAQGNLPLYAAPHAGAQITQTFYLPSGCSVAGGTFEPTFISPGFVVPLPSEPIP
jgi:hypothetical protein